MKVGITLTPHVVEGGTVREAVEHLLWAARYADEHGFDIIWSTEHHFKPGSFSSSPSIILNQFAAITERAQIGYAVAVLPLNHPIRLAEEMAWIDQFSKGRLVGGVSQGWAAYEFDVFGVDIHQRTERFEEGLTILRKAFAGGPFSHHGKYWTLNDVKILPTPYQPGGPKFVVATTSEENIKRAARLGMSPIIGFPPVEKIIALRQFFIDSARAEGVPERELDDLLTRFGALRRIIIRDSDEEADEAAMDAARGFARGARTLLTNQAGDHVEGILRRLDTPIDEADPRNLHAYHGSIWGTPDTVVRKLLALEEETSLGQVVLQFHTNTRDLEGTKETIRRFATEVLPAYRAHSRVPVAR